MVDTDKNRPETWVIADDKKVIKEATAEILKNIKEEPVVTYVISPESQKSNKASDQYRDNGDLDSHKTSLEYLRGLEKQLVLTKSNMTGNGTVSLPVNTIEHDATDTKALANIEDEITENIKLLKAFNPIDGNETTIGHHVNSKEIMKDEETENDTFVEFKEDNKIAGVVINNGEELNETLSGDLITATGEMDQLKEVLGDIKSMLKYLKNDMDIDNDNLNSQFTSKSMNPRGSILGEQTQEFNNDDSGERITIRVRRDASKMDTLHCNNQNLHDVIDTVISNNQDPTLLKRKLIESVESNKKFPKGSVNAICSQYEFSFIINSDIYCEGGNGDVACFVFIIEE
uniref:Ground-like domain-containing protein n=1 Tax=Rhabditophanes sp. KR3021 TaxID=114890 RepID=A0AC35U8E5_9BILA